MRTMAQQDRNLWVHLIGMLKKRDLLPVVAFTFSKRRCEENAASMPNTDLCTGGEKSEIHVVIERSLTRLKRASASSACQMALNVDAQPSTAIYRRSCACETCLVEASVYIMVAFCQSSKRRALPCPLSTRYADGSQMVEILFSRGLVKCLFATETFAMGVNMPARTVVFSGIRKHDGKSLCVPLLSMLVQSSSARAAESSRRASTPKCRVEQVDEVSMQRAVSSS